MIDRVKVAFVLNEPLKHYAAQLGVRYAVTFPKQGKYQPYSHIWDYGVLRDTAQEVKDAGMEWAVLEGVPFIDGAKLGLESRDEEIDHFNTLLENLGKLGHLGEGHHRHVRALAEGIFALNAAAQGQRGQKPIDFKASNRCNQF